MNKYYLMMLLALCGGTLVAKTINVADTMLPSAVEVRYEFFKSQERLNELSKEFKEVYTRIKNGEKEFDEAVLDSAVPNWQLMVSMPAV